MINLHERMLSTSAEVEPATSWSPVGRRVQLSHRDRQKVSIVFLFLHENICGYSLEVPQQQHMFSWKKEIYIYIHVYWSETKSYQGYVSSYYFWRKNVHNTGLGFLLYQVTFIYKHPFMSGNILSWRVIFSTVILSLLLIQERQSSVSGKRMCTNAT